MASAGSKDSHIELMTRFYDAFGERDAVEMGACYADDATFSDPAFPDLDAEGARAMWSMLCEQGKDLAIDMHDPWADGDRGGCIWEAHYTFTATGRKVHNVIEARFRFRDGLIAEHRDVFPFWRWTRMALGPVGWLLGWTPLLKNKVRSMAGRQLAKYRDKHGDA